MIRNWYNQIPHPALETKREITKSSGTYLPLAKYINLWNTRLSISVHSLHFETFRRMRQTKHVCAHWKSLKKRKEKGFFSISYHHIEIWGNILWFWKSLAANLHLLGLEAVNFISMSKISASERKMLSLQQQMAQNNEDLKSFMKDLDSWEADVKQKDEKLKSQKTIKETVRHEFLETKLWLILNPKMRREGMIVGWSWVSELNAFFL